MSDYPLVKIDRDPFRERLNKYSIKAFRALPTLDRPRVLDIGCGSGVPTIELAKLSNGEIVGIDIDQLELDKFEKKIQDEGLSSRVKAVNCTLFKLDFPDESFDIVWSEGSIFVIGFERGLKEWGRVLKPGGFMVVHDQINDVKNKLTIISKCGYTLLDHFILDFDIWWTDYYGLLEEHLNELREQHSHDPQALQVIKKHQDEIDMVKKHPTRELSVCFIMRKD